jgi:hypothetical protein
MTATKAPASSEFATGLWPTPVDETGLIEKFNKING